FRPRALAAFEVERRARRHGRPQAAAFPAFFRVIDAPVEPLGVVAEWIGHAQHNELAIDQREQSLVQVTGGDGHIPAQPEGVELVDPGVVARLDAALIKHALELRPGERVERPALRAVRAGGVRSVERAFAFAPIEAREVAARERSPEDALAVDVAAARAVAR